jgi:adenylyl-sulfate kinase
VKPRLLLLSYAFPPAALPEAVLSAKRFGGLADFDVDVICLQPAGTSVRLDRSLDSYISSRFAWVERLEPPLLLKPLAARKLGALFEIPGLLHVMNRRAFRAALRLRPERYAAMVTWSQWHAIHLVGLALKRRFPELPWIAHFSDPWVDNPFARYRGISRAYFRRLETSVHRAADMLSFTSDETIDLVLSGANGAYRSKAVALPHAFEPELYPDVAPWRDRPFMLRSLGNFYGARSPAPLFRALAILRGRDPALFGQIRVELIGSIPAVFGEALQACDLPQDAVRLLPPVDYKTSLGLMRSADLLLNIDAPFAQSVFLPSKLVDYIGAERPVLGITPPGTASRVIGELGGRVASPGDPDAIAAALVGALRDVAQARGAPWGNPEIRRAYQASTVAGQFKSLLATRLAAVAAAAAPFAAGRDQFGALAGGSVDDGKPMLTGRLLERLKTVALDRRAGAAQGDIISSLDHAAQRADAFAAHLIWMSDAPLLPGRTYLLKSGGQTVNAAVTELKYRVDTESFDHLAAKELHRNEIAFVNIATAEAIDFDPYDENRETGGFFLIDRHSKAKVGAGLIRFGLRRAANTYFQAFEVTKAARARLNAQKPALLWFTGLSGAGKSTIADQLDKKLHALGKHTFVLDGDNVRHGLNRDLGFTEADRVENIRRIAEVAKLFVDAGLITLVSFISPFRAEREMARDLVAPGEFIEIFVDTPLEVCERRDPKGLYKKARRGELRNFTGLDSPYEPPTDPELILDAANEGAGDLADRIIDFMQRRGLLS